MKTLILASALVSTLIGIGQAHAQSYSDFAAMQRNLVGQMATPIAPPPPVGAGSAFGTLNGQPFSAQQTPNGAIGQMNGSPFFINRF